LYYSNKKSINHGGSVPAYVDLLFVDACVISTDEPV